MISHEIYAKPSRGVQQNASSEQSSKILRKIP